MDEQLTPIKEPEDKIKTSIKFNKGKNAQNPSTITLGVMSENVTNTGNNFSYNLPMILPD